MPLTITGTALICKVPGFASTMLVLDSMAHDKQAFWDAWTNLGGDQQRLVWANGTKFDPSMLNEVLVPQQQVTIKRGSGKVYSRNTWDGSDTEEIKPRAWLVRMFDKLWLWLFPWEDDDE